MWRPQSGRRRLRHGRPTLLTGKHNAFRIAGDPMCSRAHAFAVLRRWQRAEPSVLAASCSSAILGEHGLTRHVCLLRVAAEAQRTADELGPAAETALGAADAAVKAARLAAVKLRAQVRTHKRHLLNSV